ncbi:MAG: hypothetical protein HFJ55_05370 [Clostridia bacterium]|nr:hypothetical protein [Clostridia bacterium]
MKEKKKKKENVLKRIIIVLIFLTVVAFVLIKAQNYLMENNRGEESLILNNNNITGKLKHEVKVQDGIVYISMDDVKNFFDKYIYIEDEINEIVTTYDKKIASIGFEVKKMTLNGSTKKTNASAIKDGDVVYLPISEMSDVYNMEIANLEKSKTIIIDSLNREQIKAYTKSKISVKWKKDILSRTVDKVAKGGIVIAISKDEDGWTKVRTEEGKIGYVKTKKLTNFTSVRENWTEDKQITGKVNMFWDYFSRYGQAPDRTGQTIEGVNVVSPSFFYIDKNGKLQDHVGNSGTAYIQWAHSNGYKVWPMVSSTEALSGEEGRKVVSEILNSYTKRQELIENIVEKCVQYGIDGINMDFENMYQNDKDKYSRFIIELVPRMQEVGVVTSVDVTAPDGDANWSLCFDRNILGDVADYLVFMAYDQYGASSAKPGTTAGLNWVETSLKKIIDYDVVKPEKIILGMPFYTRMWTIAADGTITGRSTVDMVDINKLIPNQVEKQWNDELKQYYVEFKSGSATKMMWIEDGASIAEKVALVTKYNLGGTSGWEKDRETSNVWSIIKEELAKKAE